MPSYFKVFSKNLKFDFIDSPSRFCGRKYTSPNFHATFVPCFVSDICQTCYVARLEKEHKEQLTYRNAKIFIRFVQDNSDPGSDDSVRLLQFLSSFRYFSDKFHVRLLRSRTLCLGPGTTRKNGDVSGNETVQGKSISERESLLLPLRAIAFSKFANT